MLTSDLVRPVIRTGSIAAPKFDKKKRATALALATTVVETVRAHIGQSRETLDEALNAIDVPAKDLLLFKGVRKLALDACTFESPGDVDPPSLRRDVFEEACRARARGGFDRMTVLKTVGERVEMAPDQLDRALFSDLKSAQLLLAVTVSTAEALVETYARAIPKAILLKAKRVVVELEADAATLRRILHRLKFMRLLFALEGGGDRWTLTVDGPMSLFSGQARYGLKLALALDVFEECAHYQLDADIRWGKRRLRLAFHHEGGGGEPTDAPAREEVERLVADFQKRKSPWSVEVTPQLLVLPKVGACVTDLSFVHAQTGEVIHLEVLGYWSRAAVFKRVDLVEGGLDDRVIFAFSEKLRVSEKAMSKDLPSVLLPFKGVLRASAAEDALERVSAHSVTPSRGKKKKKKSAKAQKK